MAHIPLELVGGVPAWRLQVDLRRGEPAPSEGRAAPRRRVISLQPEAAHPLFTATTGEQSVTRGMYMSCVVAVMQYHT